MGRIFLLAILFALFLAHHAEPNALELAGTPFSGATVIDEMNLARQHPQQYAVYLEELRGRFHGDMLALSAHTRLRTREGVRAVEEAIRFLRRARPLTPLVSSPGISMAAAEHVADQASGSYGHAGSDQSNAAERMNRYGTWSTLWGENISYGKSTARDVVIALIIDDGLRGRKHRKNIFNPTFNYAGAAAGSHARNGTVCSIDFAGGYIERGETSSRLLAGN